MEAEYDALSGSEAGQMTWLQDDDAVAHEVLAASWRLPPLAVAPAVLRPNAYRQPRYDAVPGHERERVAPDHRVPVQSCMRAAHWL